MIAPVRPVDARLIIGVLLVASASCVRHPATVDPSVHVEERRERSVTEDPAVMGEVPAGWPSPQQAPAPGQQRPPEQKTSPEAGDENEIQEFSERFKDARSPHVFEADLPPGATFGIQMPLEGPAGLAGSVKWIGTADPLKATIALNGVPLATPHAFKVGARSGSASVQAQATVGGRATLTVTNTSKVKVRATVLLVAVPQ